MEKKKNSASFSKVLKQNGIKTLYHFTDRDNLEQIIKHGGLYSWADCEKKGITVPKPGGDDLSRKLDCRDHLEHYVRLCFTRQHPMMFMAMNNGRISNPVILEINPDVVEWQDTLFSDRNATRTGASVGAELANLQNIHFSSVKARKHFDLEQEEQPYFQAEVMVKHHVPLAYITNIKNFGISIPSQPQRMHSKDAYTAQITRNTPTAFIFLIDHSGSMQRRTVFGGESMTLSEAVARIVNHQINELVLRCVKASEVRHYYDIAVIGYGRDAYSGWKGNLEGRDFVSPEELRDYPYKKIIVREEKRTRKGSVVKEVEKTQWVEAQHDGSWTRMDEAFQRAKSLLEKWMDKHHDKDCYPPTIINISDGEFNGTTKDEMIQLTNELKSMFTNDGNVILFNIHVTPGQEARVVFPVEKSELNHNSYGVTLFEMSSLLPTRYNPSIASIRNDADIQSRHVAMAVNSDMSTLLQLMDIGTPTNISQNQT